MLKYLVNLSCAGPKVEILHQSDAGQLLIDRICLFTNVPLVIFTNNNFSSQTFCKLVSSVDGVELD